jgi:hypothetical protein
MAYIGNDTPLVRIREAEDVGTMMICDNSSRQSEKGVAGSLPALEEALRSIEDLGQRSKYASGVHWIIDLYARISAGPAGVERLRRFAEVGRTQFAQAATHQAIATALGYDGFVSELSGLKADAIRIISFVRQWVPKMRSRG